MYVIENKKRVKLNFARQKLKASIITVILVIFSKRRNYYIFVIRLGVFIPSFLNSAQITLTSAADPE